jgi:hypothetical protein
MTGVTSESKDEETLGKETIEKSRSSRALLSSSQNPRIWDDPKA